MTEPAERSDVQTGALLVSLKVTCPACGKAEPRRIPRWRLDLYKHLHPERVMETVQCKCGAQYEVFASAYQGAA